MSNVEYLWQHLADKLVEKGLVKSYEQTNQGVKVKMNDSSLRYFTDEKHFINEAKRVLQE